MMDAEGLNCTCVRGTLGCRSAGRTHRMGGVGGLIGVPDQRGVGSVPPRRFEVGGRMNGAHRQVDRLEQRQAEVACLLQRRSRGKPHRVVDGRMLPGTVRARTGDVAKMRQHTGVEVDGVPQVKGYLRGGGQALRPEKQVQQCRKVVLRQAASNINTDVSAVHVNVDNNPKLVMGKFVAHGDLRIGARGHTAWPTIDFIKKLRSSQSCEATMRRGGLTRAGRCACARIISVGQA